MQNYILYVAYGSINNINECRYALLKYLDTHLSDTASTTCIVIYTDQPQFFEPYTSLYKYITIKEVTLAQIKEWRGSNDFVFRTKIKIIQDFFCSQTGNLLYCDTDTFITQSLQPIFAQIENGQFYMHQYEGIVGDPSNAYFKKWDKFLSKNPIEYNGKKLQYSNQIQMWNAGVLGLNSKNSDLLEDVLQLTDTIYEKFPKHIAEQFAFGYCMQQRGTIRSTTDAIVHYWDLKEFRIVLAQFFNQYADVKITELIKKANQLDIISMQKEKDSFKNLHWLKKIKNKFNHRQFDIKKYLNF
ncbi:MAG TPA: hypothetical protein VK718_08510 [Ferruginibacter sp.]|jgi:hypothetical protein|nr:hypothetical protein [Ferruginibacter sp.]